MAIVKTQAVALRLCCNKKGKNARPENISRIPFILPKAMSFELEKGIPKPAAHASGLIIKRMPIKMIPIDTSITIQNDAERVLHLLISLFVFMILLN